MAKLDVKAFTLDIIHMVKHHNIENSSKVISVEVTGWQECGEFAGEDPRPLLKVTTTHKN